MNKENLMYKELVKLHALILAGDLTEAAQLCDKLTAVPDKESDGAA